MPGVLNVARVFLGFGAGPALEADLAIAVRERAAFDTARIVVIEV